MEDKNLKEQIDQITWDILGEITPEWLWELLTQNNNERGKE